MQLELYATLAVTLVAFTVLWRIHVSTEDAGIVDYYWGPGFAVIGWLGLALSGNVSAEKLWFLAAVTLWAVRLALQLIDRHHKMAGEDPRYAAMRAAGGPSFWRQSLIKIFLLQGLILWVVASPIHVVLATSSSAQFSTVGMVGFLLFAIGFAIECAADWQIAKFRQTRTHPEEVLDSGLWAYSRHPNYFGEILLWIGLGLAAFDLSGSWLAFFGPLFLALTIRFVSLVLTEQHCRAARPGYQAYMERVPVLVPLPLRGSGPSVDPAE